MDTASRLAYHVARHFSHSTTVIAVAAVAVFLMALVATALIGVLLQPVSDPLTAAPLRW